MIINTEGLSKKAERHEKAFEEIFNLRLRAQVLKQEAKDLEELANAMFMGLHEAVGVDVVESDVGTLRIISKENSRVDQDKVKDYLMKKGVDSDLITDAYTKATKKSTSTYVGFYPPKKG